MTGEAQLLERLAAIWVGRWLKYGGGLIVDAGCDNIQISMALDGSRWRRKPVAGDRSKLPQRLWHDGWTVGRWRELQELGREIPGLREAIIHNVALHGKKQPWGTFHMTAPHPWSVEAA